MTSAQCFWFVPLYSLLFYSGIINPLSTKTFFIEYDAFVAERRQILEEARMLKQYATFHLHPERPVETTDPTVSARCFFGRDSAPDQETVEEAEERAQILEEARMLKQYATFYLHPERPVETTDPTACGRNYFSRPSAADQETFEEAEERAQILEEARLLKQYATFHLHPERPVETTDPTACGRNYFSRPSAPDQETFEEAEERAAIMADIEQLKQYARFHLHPEAPVETTDPTASARCYFSRPSAPDQETLEEAEERAAVLADVEQLKRYAGYHLHPERPVPRVDVSGRNFFTRPSAPDQETLEESEERARVLEEARQLKQYATFYLHPEKPVKTTDPTVFGRNFFMRASAPDQESLEESEQRAQILEDAAMLKKYATFHLHPEKGVVADDPTAMGRNFFTRPSGSESEEVTSAGHAITSMQQVFTDDHAFMMDEDMTDNLRSTLKSALVQSSGHTDADNSGKESDADSEEEGKLSRSPSSVMLFGLEDPAMSNPVH